MQFTKTFWPGLADGSITLTFRRWKRCLVVVGNRYRTPGGRIEVDVVAVSSVTDDEASRAGFSDVYAMLDQLPRTLSALCTWLRSIASMSAIREICSLRPAI
jgi:hypothetical protein